MANQFHRLQTQAELHRPERTGRGNPNNFTVADTQANFTIPEGSGLTASDFIFKPEDGQYYQDLNTGDVYRFVKYSTLAQQQTSDDFVGLINAVKREAGAVKGSLPLRNDEITSLNTISFTDDELLLLQLSTGESQVFTVSGDQEFSLTEFTVNVDEFTHSFDVGSFYGVTGTVSRFKKGGIWEKLVEYDRETETILNVSTASAKSEAIGEITVAFGGEEVETSSTGGGIFYEYNGVEYAEESEARQAALLDGVPAFNLDGVINFYAVSAVRETKQIPREVTQITANLFAELTEGEEITIVSPDLKSSIKLTVNDDGDDEVSSFGPGENIVIDVQDDLIKQSFPVGSFIFGEEGYRESSIKVDPSRVQLNVLGARDGDGIGTLFSSVGEGTFTSLTLKNINEDVSIKDGQSLILMNKFGDIKALTANGAQTLTAGTDSLAINSMTIGSGEPVFIKDTSVVKEPSYASSSRITVAEGNIALAVQEANDASSAVASLSLSVDANSASISSQAALISANSSSITTIDQRVTSAEASITSQASLISSNSSSISTIDQRVTANEANITQSVQFDDSGASIILLAGPGGSQISISADTISLNDIDVIQDDGSGYGVIKTSTFNATQGWKISGSGEAFFKKLTLGDTSSNRFVTLDAGLGQLDIDVGIAEVYDEFNIRPEAGGISTDLNFYRNDQFSGNEYLTLKMTTFTSIINGIEATRGSDAFNSIFRIIARDTFNSVTDGVFTLFPDPSGSGPDAGATIKPKLAIGVTDTSNYSGALYINGDVRWDGTTSGSAGSLVGYLQVNISGTNYKIPYYA